MAGMMRRSLQADRTWGWRAVVGARAALGPRVLSAGVRAGMPGGGGRHRAGHTGL